MSYQSYCICEGTNIELNALQKHLQYMDNIKEELSEDEFREFKEVIKKCIKIGEKYGEIIGKEVTVDECEPFDFGEEE